MTNVFSMLHSLFDYVPHFSIEDFFTPNTAVDRKASFILTLIALVKAKHADLLAKGYQIGQETLHR